MINLWLAFLLASYITSGIHMIVYFVTGEIPLVAVNMVEMLGWSILIQIIAKNKEKSKEEQ